MTENDIKNKHNFTNVHYQNQLPVMIVVSVIWSVWFVDFVQVLVSFLLRPFLFIKAWDQLLGILCVPSGWRTTQI